MSQFNDPFEVTSNPDLCDPATCPPCEQGNCSTCLPECFVCGYPDGAYENCQSSATPCLDGAVSCLDCESAFSDIIFLGGFVSGFSSRLGFGASESTLNVDIVFPKRACEPATNDMSVGVCCEPDGSCSTLYADQTDCENAGGTWISDKTCDDDPCNCLDDCTDPVSSYEGKLGYIYTFNMGSFCFRGILNTHNYAVDSSGYKYRVTLIDGRSVLGTIPVLLNDTYIKLPSIFKNSAISIAGEAEPSVADNTCGNGNQCKDFMLSGSGSNKGLKLKSALEAVNGKCISIPISNAGLKLNFTKLINIMSPILRTTNTESTLLELITLAAEESGYDFIIQINNDNEFEVLPINYKRPATDKSLFSFVQNLSATDNVISKDYGEEMSISKNKRIVLGGKISYITKIKDHSLQTSCQPNLSEATCTVLDNPASIGSYTPIIIEPTTPPVC